MYRQLTSRQEKQKQVMQIENKKQNSRLIPKNNHTKCKWSTDISLKKTEWQIGVFKKDSTT